MEKNKTICAWVDENYHQKVKGELETARRAIWELLNEWGKLQLGFITDINRLLLYPEQCYKAAIEQLIPIPVDERFAVKKEAVIANYSATHDLPDPSKFYKVAKATMRVNYCAIPDLFETQDGQAVSLNEGIANFYITMSDIIIPESEPDKIALAADLKAWVDLTNSLNIRLNQELFDSASPVSNRFFWGRFAFENTNGRGGNGTLVLLSDTLRRWLNV